MVKRQDASARGDPTAIDDSQINPQTLANRRTIDTLLPFVGFINADTITHTLTFALRQSGGKPEITIATTIAAGQFVAFPTLPFSAVSSDSAGAPSNVLMFYTDVPPSGPRSAAGSGNSIVAGILNSVNNQTINFLPLQDGDFGVFGGFTEAEVRTTVHVAMTIKNLSIKPQTNTLGAGAAVYTLVKNGTPTALTVSVPFGSTAVAEDTTHQVSVNPGDTLSWKIDLSNTVSGNITATHSAQVVA